MHLALVSMPWAIFNRPSIQLGALQSFLRHNAPDIKTATFHPYLDTAKAIGMDSYRIISNDLWAGEALYCALLFPERLQKAKNVFSNSLGKRIAATLPSFDHLCESLDNQLDTWVHKNDFSSFSLVGFSVCFGQLPATLLAVKRLKKIYPNIKTVLGGSTCVPEIGHSLLSVFEDIDFVIAGEGELSLFELCHLLEGKTKETAPGILTSSSNTSDEVPSNPALGKEIKDFNTLPPPDYEGYFSELKQSGLGFIPQLPLEFSRGCWWNKCTFCNLNLQWCGYRYKTSDRMQHEVEMMTSKYRCLDFAFTDNALPPAEAERFFNAFQNCKEDRRFFAEIRTTHKPDQYSTFKNGGLASVQIGIEAFSNSLLKRMNKGSTVMDNIAAMKNCTEVGIQLDGNLILEFPGSTEQEVIETLEVLDFALPFRPLASAGFFLGHGSPVWAEPEKYGIKSIRHHPYNRNLYPPSILRHLGLLIKQGAGDRKRQKKLWQPVRKKIQEWEKFHKKRPSSSVPLSYREGGDFIIIRQERPGQHTQHHRLVSMSREIYLACSNPVSIKSLLKDFNSITEKALKGFLNDLESKKLLFRDGDVYLALAVRSR